MYPRLTCLLSVPLLAAIASAQPAQPKPLDNPKPAADRVGDLAPRKPVAPPPAPKEAPPTAVDPHLAALLKRTMPDEEIIARAGSKLSDEGVAAFLERNGRGGIDFARIAELIRKLGSAKFREREEAVAALVKLGRQAVEPLRKAAEGSDPEVKRNAQVCLQQIGPAPPAEALVAAVRVLLKRGPQAAIPALLRIYPTAANEEVEEEIAFGLDGMVEEAKSVPDEMRKALGDTDPKRRAIAACVVGHRGTEAQRRQVEALLNDRSAEVRLRTAQGLLAARNAVAIPPLIELLSESNIGISLQAEELLRYVAG